MTSPIKIIDYSLEWCQYLESEKRYSMHTVNGYRTDLELFIKFLTEHLGKDLEIYDVIAVDIICLRSWLANRRKNDYEFRATARAIAAVRNFYKFMAKYHNLINKSIHQLKTPKLPSLLPRPLSEQDCKRTISSLEDYHEEPWINSRDKALALLLYGCGLRISEALGLTKAEIENSTLRIIGKRNKERVVPLLPVVRKSIEDYLKICPYQFADNDYIFVGLRGKKLQPAIFQKVIANIRRQLGLPDSATPHAFRHSFATHLLQNHPEEMDPLRLIQQLLGHESLATTQRYTQLDRDYIMKNYKLAHPRDRDK